jgi:hypothetical protein
VSESNTFDQLWNDRYWDTDKRYRPLKELCKNKIGGDFEYIDYLCNMLCLREWLWKRIICNRPRRVKKSARRVPSFNEALTAYGAVVIEFTLKEIGAPRHVLSGERRRKVLQHAALGLFAVLSELRNQSAPNKTSEVVDPTDPFFRLCYRYLPPDTRRKGNSRDVPVLFSCWL